MLALESDVVSLRASTTILITSSQLLIRSLYASTNAPSLKKLLNRNVASITDGATIKGYIIKDKNEYEIGVFETWQAMQERIIQKKSEGKIAKLLATYDFKYNDHSESKCYMISKGTSESYKPLFWHRTGSNDSTTAKLQKTIWTTNDDIDEVGSIHHIQGFDLDYSGVILGASVSFNDNIISFQKTNRFSLPTDPMDDSIARELMSNENHVLMTRGIKGLYIWARNKKLRDALIKSITEEY